MINMLDFDNTNQCVSMQTIIDNHKLIKIKIELEYELSGMISIKRKTYSMLLKGIFRVNRRDIIDEAVDNMAIRITAKEIKTKAISRRIYWQVLSMDKCYFWNQRTRWKIGRNFKVIWTHIPIRFKRKGFIIERTYKGMLHKIRSNSSR